MNSAAATRRIAFMLTFCARRSPSQTAGALAIIMPSVVPTTTAASGSKRAASAIVANCVLSPISARKNTTSVVRNTLRLE